MWKPAFPNVAGRVNLKGCFAGWLRDSFHRFAEVTVRFMDLGSRSNSEPKNFSDSTALLDCLRTAVVTRPPFFCEITSSAATKLLVGVGQFGCVQYSTTDGEPPYWLAVYRNDAWETDELSFLFEGEATPVALKNTMPFEIVELVIRHFCATGERSADVSWEQI